MPSFEDLYSPLRFQGRVAGKTLTGIANTGIDVVNLFRDLDDQFKPIDLDEDVYNSTITTVANKVADVTNPDRGAQAKAVLTSMTRAPESAIGEFSEDGATFLLGFLGGRKAIQAGVSGLTKGATLGRAAKLGIDTAAGAGSAFVLEDPVGNRLVNFIPEEHRPAFIDYLAYDPEADESRLEGRFKNALVDMGLGVLADGAFGLVAKSFKHLRRDIHLEAAGDPEVVAKLVDDVTGLKPANIEPPLPPKVDLSSEGFEKSIASETTEQTTKEGLKPPKFTTEDEVAAVEAILKIGPKGEQDVADVIVNAMNHTHFDYTKPEETVDLANKILVSIRKHLTNQNVETWDQVLAKSNEVSKKTALSSFEEIAELTGRTVAEIQQATPVVHMIRRMYTESGVELQALKSKYLQAKPKAQAKLRKEIQDRIVTHMALTQGVSELGTGAGRLLRSFGMKATGDLGAFGKAVKPAAGGAPQGAPKGKGKARSTKDPKPLDPKDFVKKAQNKVEKLTKELDKLRARFGDDGKLPKGKQKAPDSPEVKDLKDRIKFYKTAEADANRIVKLEAKLEALQQLAKRGSKLDLEAGLGKLDPPKAPKTSEEQALRKQISDLKKSMAKQLKALEPPKSLEDRVAEALADNSAEGVARAVQEATEDELHNLIEALRSVDMTDAKAWIKQQQQETGGVLKFLQALRKIKMMNILSGIPTLVMNTTGNTASALFRSGFEDLVASMVPVKGADRMTLFGEARAMRAFVEQPQQLMGELFKEVSEAIRKGEPISEVFARLAVDDVTRLREEHVAMDLLINSNSTGARIVNSMGRLAHALSFGHMELTDMAYKQVLFTKNATGMAEAKGALKGLKGADFLDYKQTMVEQAIFLARKGKLGARHILSDLKAKGMSMEDSVKHLNDVADMVNESRRYAKEGVFQDEISSATLKGFETFINKNNAGTHLFKTLVIPFYRTPVKIVEFAWERTPILNMTSRKLRADLKGINGARAQQRAYAKFITGTTMYLGAMQLAQSNLITGKHRPEERDALLAANVPEYSIRIPHTDEWISFQRLDPFAMFLGITADLNKLVEEDKLDGGTAAAAMMNALSSNVLNKTFMKGLSDSLKASNSPAEFGAYYTDSQVRAIVSPLSSFQRSFEKVWNANSEEYRKQKPEPAFSELRDWVDILIGDTGLTNTREYDMSDALGNKIKRGPLWSELTGFRYTETESSPSLRQLALHKRFPSNRELSLATGFKMDREEFMEFKEILGGPQVRLKERMDQVVQTQAYRRASSEKQAQMLDKVIRDSRKLAKGLLLRQDPALKAQVVQHNRERLMGSLRNLERATGVPSIDEILQTRRQILEREE